ncbi:MAG: radical SAM protein [Clostridia bacterium]|nr:radical SAM protein [Clostridia bacterium]
MFCNQRSISGCSEFREEDVARQIDRALQTIPSDTETEIAFFGGSFTGIDRGLMCRLLDLAETYVRAGRVTSIRLSTRPDYIDGEILEILSGYSVRVIELGLQSMDDSVLERTKRGHTALDARRACHAIKAAGFSLVGQMMIGLPASTPESEEFTAREIVALGADAVRIYPTVVFWETELCEMVKNREYTPLSEEDAVRRSAAVLRIFTEAKLPCIRIGLCSGEGLTSEQSVMAGPNHPALGELVWNEYYYQNLLTALDRASLRGREVVLYVPEREVSKTVGQHRRNVERLFRETDTRVRKIVGEKERRETVAAVWQAARREEEQPCI